MKKRIVIFALAVGMLASFTGCQELDDGINISIQSEKQTTQEKKETEETDKNERTEEVNIMLSSKLSAEESVTLNADDISA